MDRSNIAVDVVISLLRMPDQAAFRGQNDFVSAALKRLADDFFRQALTIGWRCVDKRDAFVDGGLDRLDRPQQLGETLQRVVLGLDRGLAGPLTAPSSYFMKSPPEQFPDDIARNMTEEFIAVQK